MSRPTGPLTPEQWETLKRLVEGLSHEQFFWLSGYLTGLGADASDRPSPPIAPTEKPESSTTILYGSQTGNAEKLAEGLQTRLTAVGIVAHREAMGNYKTAQLKRDARLLVIVSTHGEGDPPDNALSFHQFLHSRKAPRLDGAQFAVLALGDTSYEHFCKTGRDFDQRLEELGGTRLHPRLDCDVDYEEAAEAWMDSVVAALSRERQTCIEVPVAAGPRAESTPVYSKKNPFSARLIENLRLTGRDSTKDVRHIEFDLTGSGLRFEPGDSLGIMPRNWPQYVSDLLACLRLDPSSPVTGISGDQVSLEHALLSQYEITTATRSFLDKYAELSGAVELAQLLTEDHRALLRGYLYGREIIDVVREHPVPDITSSQFLGLLRKLPPRLYSIASSHNADPDQVHLTVSVVRYQSHGLKRHGVASTFLADRVAEDGPVPVYVDANTNFRLPTDPEAPIVMVGPGTGVAPFRAFLAEREIAGARGRNWLIFGDRTFHSDFLYQAEWLSHRRKGLLNRMDVAFSRDGAEKLYVQHRILENRRELYRWLEGGAYFYVCGDAQRMAPDVHEALVAVVASESACSRERAEDYVNALQSAKRYQRDVY